MLVSDSFGQKDIEQSFKTRHDIQKELSSQIDVTERNESIKKQQDKAKRIELAAIKAEYKDRENDQDLIDSVNKIGARFRAKKNESIKKQQDKAKRIELAAIKTEYKDMENDQDLINSANKIGARFRARKKVKNHKLDTIKEQQKFEENDMQDQQQDPEELKKNESKNYVICMEKEQNDSGLSPDTPGIHEVDGVRRPSIDRQNTKQSNVTSILGANNFQSINSAKSISFTPIKQIPEEGNFFTSEKNLPEVDVTGAIDKKVHLIIENKDNFNRQNSPTQRIPIKSPKSEFYDDNSEFKNNIKFAKYNDDQLNNTEDLKGPNSPSKSMNDSSEQKKSQNINIEVLCNPENPKKEELIDWDEEQLTQSKTQTNRELSEKKKEEQRLQRVKENQDLFNDNHNEDDQEWGDKDQSLEENLELSKAKSSTKNHTNRKSYTEIEDDSIIDVLENRDKVYN